MLSKRVKVSSRHFNVYKIFPTVTGGNQSWSKGNTLATAESADSGQDLAGAIRLASLHSSSIFLGVTGP
jgi:hypothetical protein